MKHVPLILLAAALSSPALAAPAKHTKHAATHHSAQFDATVNAAVADAKRQQDEIDDGHAQIQAYLRGDQEGMAEAQLRMQRRECQDRDLYMKAYEAASPNERQVMHERCYGSRGK